MTWNLTCNYWRSGMALEIGHALIEDKLRSGTVQGSSVLYILSFMPCMLLYMLMQLHYFEASTSPFPMSCSKTHANMPMIGDRCHYLLPDSRILADHASSINSTGGRLVWAVIFFASVSSFTSPSSIV